MSRGLVLCLSEDWKENELFDRYGVINGGAENSLKVCKVSNGTRSSGKYVANCKS